MPGGYNILPLAPDQLDWLKSHGIHVARMERLSRFPTVSELRGAISMLADFQARFDTPDGDQPWRVVLESERQPGGKLESVIRITPFSGEETPHGFWFEKGWRPLVVAIARQLAGLTGPLVVLATGDGTPALVEAGSDVGDVLRTWKHTAGRYA